MSQNGQARFAAFAAIFLKCVWPFYDIAKQRINNRTLRLSKGQN